MKTSIKMKKIIILVLLQSLKAQFVLFGQR